MMSYLYTRFVVSCLVFYYCQYLIYLIDLFTLQVFQETITYLRSVTKVLEMSQVLLEMDMDMTCELRAVARLTHLLSPLPHKSHHELYLHECYSFFFHYYIYVSLASSKGRPFDV